jgi:hypothetical protein
MRMRAPLAVLLVLGLAGATFVAAAQKTPAPTARVKVIAEQANLREKPDIGSAIVQQIPEGTVLEADKREGEWYFVRYVLEDGGVIGGWLHESLVEPVEGAPPVPVAPVPAGASGPRPPATVAPAARSAASVFPLELSVSGGVATLAPRDLNDGARGFPAWFGGMTGIPAPETADILHVGAAVEVELAYRVSPRLAVGLGAGYLRASNADRMTFADELTSWTVSTRPSVTSGAVKATVRFYPGAGLYVRGALGLYSVRAGYTYRYEGGAAGLETKGSASATTLGGEAAFGGEWAVGPRTAFFVEAGLRMAGFDALDGENTDSDSADERVIETGTLYYYRRVATDGNDYALVAVRSSPPAGTDFTGTRRAEINISGMSIRVGLRYRF